jgi:hypothetical protein
VKAGCRLGGRTSLDGLKNQFRWDCCVTILGFTKMVLAWVWQLLQPACTISFWDYLTPINEMN